MRLDLRTLQAESFKEQVRTIDRLAAQNPRLSEEIRCLLTADSESPGLRSSTLSDEGKLASSALLAVVAADMATVPHKTSREKHRQDLLRLCQHYGIPVGDVITLSVYAAQVENTMEPGNSRIEVSLD